MSINWTKSLNLNYDSGQGTANYTVEAPTGAQSAGWVQAVVTGPCGTLTFRHNVWVGKPTITYYPPDPHNPCHGNPYYEGPNIEGVTYTWSENNPDGWLGSNGGYQTNMLSTKEAYYTLTLTISDGNCSETTSISAYTTATYCECFYAPECDNQSPSPLSVYPNPSTTYFELSYDELENDKEKKAYKVEIYDNLGNKRLESLVKKNKERIDISKLPEGIYILHFYKNEGVLKKQISIKRE